MDDNKLGPGEFLFQIVWGWGWGLVWERKRLCVCMSKVTLGLVRISKGRFLGGVGESEPVRGALWEHAFLFLFFFLGGGLVR